MVSVSVGEEATIADHDDDETELDHDDVTRENHADIESNSKQGIFSLSQIKRRGKRQLSMIFKKNAFMSILNAEGEIMPRIISCSICETVFNHNRNTGTSNLIKHM